MANTTQLKHSDVDQIKAISRLAGAYHKCFLVVISTIAVDRDAVYLFTATQSRTPCIRSYPYTVALRMDISPCTFPHGRSSTVYRRSGRCAFSTDGEKAQSAFKDLMIHNDVQFTLRIALRRVLHRCVSQFIHC